MSERFDLIIVGAGISGILTAARAALANPSQKILLIEKENNVGGRLRDTNIDDNRWSYGFNLISDSLFQYWDQTLKSQGEAEHDLPSFGGEKQTQVAALSGSKVSRVPIENYFSKKGGRMIGGLASQRDWTKVDDIVALTEGEGEKAGATFSQVWSGNRKSASAIALEHMAHSFGIPDVWTTTPKCLVDRANYHTSQLLGGNWEAALETTLKPYIESEQITLSTETMIVGARIIEEKADSAAETTADSAAETTADSAVETTADSAADTVAAGVVGDWELKTSIGLFTTPKLVIAQSPWEAMYWLPKNYWPSALLNIVNKAKPVSVVILSEKLTSEEPLPNIVLITAEGVQAVVNNERKEVSFQATIDYEMTLQAPAVVKAVKRLKRARKKLLISFPDSVTSTDHIALLPVGWGQSTSSSEHRLFQKLNKVNINSDNLYFVGDGYGASFDGDENVTESVSRVCDMLTGGSEAEA